MLGLVYRTWPDKEDPLLEIIFATDTFLLSHCGELTQDNNSNVPLQTGDLYIAILLSWLATWSEDMKQAVMLDAHFMTSGFEFFFLIYVLKNMFHCYLHFFFYFKVFSQVLRHTVHPSILVFGQAIG